MKQKNITTHIQQYNLWWGDGERVQIGQKHIFCKSVREYVSHVTAAEISVFSLLPDQTI